MTASLPMTRGNCMTKENDVSANTTASMPDMGRTQNDGIVTATDKTSFSKERTCASSDKPPDLVKRIGNTTYEVSFHFSDTSRDTFTDKIARLIRRDLQNG